MTDDVLSHPSFRDVDRALADLARRRTGSADAAVATALASLAVGQGHSCFVPGEAAALFAGADTPAPKLPTLDAGLPWIGDGLPLAFDRGRLYLRRYLRYEQRLAAALLARAVGSGLEPNEARLARNLGSAKAAGQRRACEVALKHRFAIISGGPGTGKTYTVIQLCELFVDAFERARGRRPRIRLAAPTGKAAAHIGVTFRKAREERALADGVPAEASTLHRLLGARPGATTFRHSADYPLDADLVIVDEASMVDLGLMTKLVEAVPPQATLVLVGDHHQLASVEAGSVLADLVAAAPLADLVVELEHGFRSGRHVTDLAEAINAGDAVTTLARLGQERIVLADRRALGDAHEKALGRSAALESSEDPETWLGALEERRILCALRRDVERINRHLAAAVLAARERAPGTAWYHGQPVLVLQNDPHLGLFNGDVGVCVDGKDGLRAWFKQASGEPRPYPPATLPPHETCYAMTVHKAQGSEFGHVDVVLPEEDSPILTRELLYTAVTRARDSLAIYGDETSVRRAVERRVLRFSGLTERIEAKQG